MRSDYYYDVWYNVITYIELDELWSEFVYDGIKCHSVPETTRQVLHINSRVSVGGYLLRIVR